MARSEDEKRVNTEEAYFAKANADALERIRARQGLQRSLPSPVSGKPMETITIFGVAVDRCPTSGGIWLDKGEIERLLRAYSEEIQHHENHYSIADFFLKIFRYDDVTTKP
jgi:Zn-finger nucleic acid-binding protein